MVGQRDKVGDMDDRKVEPHLPLFDRREPVWTDEGVDVADRRLHEPRVPPPLRWTSVGQGAEHAVLLHARGLPELEEDVGGTDQPVFVKRVELDPPPIRQDRGSPHQGDVVVVDHVEAGIENLAQCPGLEERISGLLRGQGREPSERALQAMHHDPRMLPPGWPWVPAGQRTVGVLAVDDLDVMAPAREFAGQPLDEDPVAAEIVGRVEGRDHAEAQRSIEPIHTPGTERFGAIVRES